MKASHHALASQSCAWRIMHFSIMHFPSCTIIRQAWLQQTLKLSLKSTGHQMFKVREHANTQEIHVCETIAFALAPGQTKNKFENWVLEICQDHPVSCMVHDTVVEGGCSLASSGTSSKRPRRTGVNMTRVSSSRLGKTVLRLSEFILNMHTMC